MKRAKIISQPNHSATDSRFVESVRAIAHPLDGSVHDYICSWTSSAMRAWFCLGQRWAPGQSAFAAETRAVEPIERTRGEASEKPPLTYPFEV